MSAHSVCPITTRGIGESQGIVSGIKVSTWSRSTTTVFIANIKNMITISTSISSATTAPQRHHSALFNDESDYDDDDKGV